MLEQIKAFLLGEDAPSDGRDGVPLAAAALLVEAAMADGAMDRDEEQLIVALLAAHFALDQAAAGRLLTRARREQERSSQLFPFAKRIVDDCAAEERIALLEMLWQVAYADGELHDYEASLVRRVAGLLYVSDQDSGHARRRALAALGIAGDPLA